MHFKIGSHTNPETEAVMTLRGYLRKENDKAVSIPLSPKGILRIRRQRLRLPVRCDRQLSRNDNTNEDIRHHVG